MQFIKNLSLRYKLFLAYGVLAITVFVVSFSILFFQIRENIAQQIRSELNKSNKTITDMVEISATVSIKNHLRAIAEKNKEILENIYDQYRQNIVTEAHAKQRAVQILLSQSVGETGYIYCIDSKGIVVVHPKDGVRGEDVSSHDFIKQQIKSKSGYLEYDWKNPGEPSMRPKALYMSYFEPWDWIISVSSYRAEFSKLISINDFRDRILELKFGKTGYSFILDTKGYVIVHPEISGYQMDTTGADGFPIIREMIRQKRGYLTYTWKNPSEVKAREKFVAFDYIPEFEWIIASSSYTQEVFSPLEELKKTFWLIVILTLMCTGAVTLLISSYLTKPLNSFIKNFGKGAREGWVARLDADRNDEIGQFSKSFNLFMKELDDYRRELVSEIKVRKKAENEIMFLRRYLENIIDSMPSVIIGIDMDGRTTLWNNKAHELTGVTNDDARKRPLAELLPGMTQHMGEIQEILKKREIKYIRNVVSNPEDLDKRYEDIIVYPLTKEGFEGAVIRIDDVTDKIRMEEALVHNEKMVSVGGLAAGMAHEINNPLAGVMQNAQVLVKRLTEKDLKGNVDAAQASGTTMASIMDFMARRDIPNMAQAIIESCRRMSAIVDNMLSFVRKSEHNFTQNAPDVLMEKALELAAIDFNLNKQYDFRSIKIQKQYEPDLPMISCQKNEIQQVLLNVLCNGAHAMFEKWQGLQKNESGPEFVVRINFEPLQDLIRIEIQDNGTGLDETMRKRVFEPFFTTKPVGLGTGLGLSVSYFIITENHGGQMDVRSVKDQETTFIIQLPVKGKQSV